jgi:hypothetical protein
MVLSQNPIQTSSYNLHDMNYKYFEEEYENFLANLDLNDLRKNR